MPMRRRASRSARPLSLARSVPMNRISPEVGLVRRLMQRIRVDLPVPDGPMIAVMPRPANVSEISFRTGWPLRYSLERLRRVSTRLAVSAAVTDAEAFIASISLVISWGLELAAASPAVLVVSLRVPLLHGLPQ